MFWIPFDSSPLCFLLSFRFACVYICWSRRERRRLTHVYSLIRNNNCSSLSPSFPSGFWINTTFLSLHYSFFSLRKRESKHAITIILTCFWVSFFPPGYVVVSFSLFPRSRLSPRREGCDVTKWRMYHASMTRFVCLSEWDEQLHSFSDRYVCVLGQRTTLTKTDRDRYIADMQCLRVKIWLICWKQLVMRCDLVVSNNC